MTYNPSRRQLAKGAAWSAPAIALASTVPALAASQDSYGANVCSLFYGKGESQNHQTHSLYLGVKSTSRTIPKGTVFTWTVTMEGRITEVPTVNYSQNRRWILSTDPRVPGTGTRTLTVRLTVNSDGVTAQELNCVPRLIWSDTYSVTGGTKITIRTSTTVPPGQGSGIPSSLIYTVAKRYPVSVNARGRLAHHYLSKSGDQGCYPSIKYVMTAASKLRTCGDGGNDTSTVYPDGTCVKIDGTTQDIGSQQTVPEKC